MAQIADGEVDGSNVAIGNGIADIKGKRGRQVKLVATIHGTNRLSGEVFCYPVIVGGQERRKNPAWNALDYDPSVMRVIGEADGKLCFVTSSELKYVPANSAFLYVSEDAASTLPTDGSTGIKSVKNQPTTTAKGRYTLQGVQIPDNVEPQKGPIYIEDGKLVLQK